MIEEFLILDKKNFREYTEEIKELFSSTSEHKSKAFEIKWCSSGSVPYKLKAHSETMTIHHFERYLVSEYCENSLVWAKPKFFLRTTVDDYEAALIIERISERQLKHWEEYQVKDKDFFGSNRYEISSPQNVQLDMRFFEASDNAYLRFSIKRSRLNIPQRKELKALLDNLVEQCNIPRGSHDLNAFEIQYLVEGFKNLTSYRVSKK